ncbi:tRNA uridine 5-carboxymethylaminomethyl modification enzyme MnmG [Phycisphaerae bacterium RAS1]|nr:tRNA uridine 5-carboxymethylaminomethyl modification enzyme MnmG [Phycisphaerae bacterium RAS1]
MNPVDFDVLVIGGGHAGAEAAWAAAHLGARTTLVTFTRDAIGRMSCNPAIGGIGKGQIVREVDALGGLMGLVTDETGIQFRMLNRSKGPAVWALRAQCDRELYAGAVQRRLAECPNLEIVEAGVEEILAGDAQYAESTENAEIESAAPTHRPADATRAPAAARRVTGVRLSDGRIVNAPAVVVTSGTFLRALMHTGEQKTEGGRIGEKAAVGLSASLSRLGLELGRLKTGTPPRLKRDTIDFSSLDVQPGDDPPVPFSFMTDRLAQSQVPCWISYTNAAIHERIRANLHRAPMYSGQIASRGPRYCPSIEDKVVRFADKNRHQVFLEPEGRESDRIYVNGVSTSLPIDVQREMIAGIPGLERAEVLQWGYAVEYDFVPPEQVDAALMTKRILGLFLAGQINGTSGYEEAAGQGLMAGINAARYVAQKPPVVLRRDQAYIGVMIDDLVTRGVTEPYRMFTSRAEYRLHLRHDNADQRLTPLAHEIGLADSARWERYRRTSERVGELLSSLRRLRWENKTLEEWIRRPEETGDRFRLGYEPLSAFSAEPDVWARAVIEVKYDGYLKRQQRVIEEHRAFEERGLPTTLDYASIPHLRREAVERWNAVRPRNVGQAARISGIHPTDVSMLLVHLAARGSSEAVA